MAERKRVVRGSRRLDSEQTCAVCKEVKPRTAFRLRSKATGAVTSQCRDCWNAWRRSNRKAYPTKASKEYRESNVRRKRGMTEALFVRMFAEQQGRCAICRISMSIQTRRADTAHIDHDHTTGKVRELLCARCNTALGLFRENADTLFEAVSYVMRHSEVTLTAIDDDPACAGVTTEGSGSNR